MNAVARIVMSITAVLGWAASVAVGVACGFEIDNGRSWFPISDATWIPYWWTVSCGVIALATPAAAIAIVASMQSLTRFDAVCVVWCWLMFVLLKPYAIVTVLAVHLPFNYGFVSLSLFILMLELVATCLPAFVAMTRDQQRGPVADQDAPQVTPANATRTESTLKPLPPTTFRDLIRRCQQDGRDLYPGVTLEKDGSLFAGQRDLAGALGLPLSTGNARLWKEHRAGDITVTTDSRGTRIALTLAVPSG